MIPHGWSRQAETVWAHTSTCSRSHSGAWVFGVGAQCNCFVLMLSMAVAFYFSKSVKCCEALVVHYTCAQTFLTEAMAIDCMGYETCQELHMAESSMPEELLSAPFVCDAFPQNTLFGRITVILAIAVVLVPVQM
jgi:hypothetical protein